MMKADEPEFRCLCLLRNRQQQVTDGALLRSPAFRQFDCDNDQHSTLHIEQLICSG